MVPVTINGVPIEMEVDTGAKASLIGKNIFNRYFSNQSLWSTGRLVWGTPLPMMGEFTATVCYKDQRALLTVCVVNQDFPALFGLPWMKYIRLDWPSLLPEVLSVSMEPEPNRDRIAEFKGKYPHVFSYVPSPILNFEVSLQLSEGAQPVFTGPRVIAIPLCEKTKATLNLMEKSEFIEARPPGPWGIPIVPVLKSSGEVQICGDFSVTLNPCLEVTGQALPLIDDLSTVSGNWFCILDMTQAYLQLKLSEASQEICKLNTSFGRYKCKRMLFGISSAPGIYQEVLVPYSLDWPLRLTADASPVGAGCVLAHVTEDGKEEPIAFASKSFSDRKLRYPVHEREAAALIFGLKKFNKYLCA